MAKILIIEDRRENIVFIANNILKPKGHEVITARDGQIGLKKAQEEFPDLIITDIKLPKMSGLEVLQNLREQGVLIPTIVMTFHGTEETAVKALRLGARDYLIKPFTMEEMEAALDRAFRPQPTTPEAYRQKLETEARITSLEAEAKQLKKLLREREIQLARFQQQSANLVDKMEMAEVAERAAVWEEDNARLNEMLAETKDDLNQAQSRGDVLEKAIMVQKVQTGKYQQETKRLANELRNLTEAIRLMSQDMEHQMKRLVVLTPQEKE